ncbi:phage tail assembly protein [Cognatishimia sp. MH4019]|uniref:phage tail assembly protein n=1 Tax=Cognatishimia sp. MH4019 TaxID=2854030 RepID=UPI001CD4CD20|nr:phage tail assembly protein [Cognatishimia sp. MH4019]
MAQTETYTLEYPFTYKGEEVTELTIRRPKMRDLKKFEGIKDNMKKSFTMLSDLAEIAPDAVEELDPVDFNAASVMIAGFLGVSEEEIQKISGQFHSS